MKALPIFSNDFNSFFILSTFNTDSLKVFKKICRKKPLLSINKRVSVALDAFRTFSGTTGKVYKIDLEINQHTDQQDSIYWSKDFIFSILQLKKFASIPYSDDTLEQEILSNRVKDISMIF